MQNYLNLIYEEEREILPYCIATGVGIIPWSLVARGVLARPWNSERTLWEETDAYISALIDRESAADEAVVGRVEEVANKRGVPMAAIASAWVLTKGANHILGLSSIEESTRPLKR
ncbi:alcohol dehydrogenase [Exophiala aquamarina CBS 119918]|uniref:Alcohol dehydrogenase n=1 Tax=Exophiala aquamarina CBS 119918 TaxID=1182545 RepID=A0A072P8G4_9EURO|nr:alcohol dehydrogenase [Exophiala aquamarina CBS 119918]KEF55578.1 alcohol dehydrogenase [Exophiala aquamarina CBS 119918]